MPREPRQNTALGPRKIRVSPRAFKPPSNNQLPPFYKSRQYIFHDGNSKNPFSPIPLVYMGLRAYKPLSSYIFPSKTMRILFLGVTSDVRIYSYVL